MQPISFPLSPEGLGGVDSASPRSSGGGFAKALGDALAEVDELQVQADGQSERLALGEGNLHEAALALETADVAMRAAVKVRNKLVDAYQEIMRMNL